MKKLLVFGIIASLLTLTSCSKIMSSFYGLKVPRERSPEKIQHFADKYGIPTDKSFVLDTSYMTFLVHPDTTQKVLIKNHLQPLQALYFDHSGQLVSYYINCNAGGFPNLKWNRNGLLDTFVPTTQTPTDTLLTLSRQLDFVRTMDNKSPGPTDYSQNDYTVVIYWSIFMGRQSKRLIKSIITNCHLAKGKSIDLLFVNEDNFFGHYGTS